MSTVKPDNNLASYNMNNNDFQCLECYNKTLYQLKNGKCEKCKMKYCLSCEFKELGEPNQQSNFVENIYKPVCNKCIPGYFVDTKTGECVLCHNVPIDNGNCTVCKEKNYNINFKCSLCLQHFTDEKGNLICSFCKENYYNKSIECVCDEGYTQTSLYDCEPCPKYCKKCNYDNKTEEMNCTECFEGFTLKDGKCVKCCEYCNKCSYTGGEIKCLKCQSGRTINSRGNCYECPENCTGCIKDSNGTIICTDCDKFFGLNDENECEPCPEHCEECVWNFQNDNFTCIKCQESKKYNSLDNYILGEYNQCVRCQNIKSIGGPGCIRCRYRNKKYECLQCLGDTTNYMNAIDPYKNYTYIINQFICKENLNLFPQFLHGCLMANYISSKNIYECISCKDDFTFIINEKKYLLSNQLEIFLNCCNANNIMKDKSNEPIYTCVDCKYEDNVKLYYFFGNYRIMRCLPRFGNLHNCLEAEYIDENENETNCTKCVNNYEIVYNKESDKYICSDNCAKDYFQYYDDYCYECDSNIHGNIGCESKEGCSFNPNNGQLDCVNCKKGYYKFLNQCFACSLEDPYCEECYFDDSNENKKRFVCNKCRDKYEVNYDNFNVKLVMNSLK